MECHNTENQKANFKHKTKVALAPVLLGLVGSGFITAESVLRRRKDGSICDQQGRSTSLQ